MLVFIFALFAYLINTDCGRQILYTKFFIRGKKFAMLLLSTSYLLASVNLHVQAFYLFENCNKSIVELYLVQLSFIFQQIHLVYTTLPLHNRWDLPKFGSYYFTLIFEYKRKTLHFQKVLSHWPPA